MNAKKNLMIVLIGAVALGMMASSVSADDPEETIREPKTVDIDNDEIPDSSDITIGIDSDDVSWEDQPFWDDPNVKGGDLIIAPAPDNSEQDEELDILSGKTESADENVVMNSGIPVIGAIGAIGILGTALIIIKRRKME